MVTELSPMENAKASAIAGLAPSPPKASHPTAGMSDGMSPRNAQRKLCGRRGASTWARQEERVALLLSAGLFGSLSENHAIGPSSHFFKRGARTEAASACRASIVVGQAKIRRGTCGLVDLKKQTKASIFESCCKSASPCPLLISPARCTARRLAARASDNPWSQNWAPRKMQRPPRSGRTTQLCSSQCH